MMKKFMPRSLLLRYIISYIIVIALIFIGISVYACSSVDSAIRDSVIESNTNRLAVLRVQHEGRLSALSCICNQIGLSPKITAFKFVENPMEAYHLKQLLASFQAANNFSDQLYLTFHEDDFLYSFNTSVSMSLFTEKFMHYEDLPPDELYQLLKEPHDSAVILPAQSVHSVPAGETADSMVTFIMPLRLEGKYSIGNMLFLVNDHTYQQMFADEIYEARDMYILSDGKILSSSHRLGVSDELVLEQIGSRQGNFMKELSADGKSYLLFVQPGSLFGLKYAALIPQETIRQLAVKPKLTFGIFLLFLGIPCSLLTVWFALHHIRPIRELQRSFGSGNGTQDDFAAIHSGLEALMGQNMDLHTKLDATLSAQRANFVKEFIKNRFTCREAAIEAAREIELDIDRSCYLISIISAVTDDSMEPERLDALAECNAAVTICGAEFVSQEQYLMLAFSDSRATLDQWAEHAKTALSSVYQDAAMAVSNIHEDFSEAGIAYMEAGTAYDNRFVMGSEFVLRFSDVSAATKDIGTLSRRFLDDFNCVLQSGSGEALDGWVNEMFQTLTEKKISLFAFRMIVNNIISALLDKYFSSTGAPVDALQYYSIFTLSRCQRSGDLMEVLRKLCGDILLTQNKTEKSNTMQQVNIFLREHYTDPNLTVGSVAETFGMSSTRLSLEYKEQTGMHPSVFLLSLRIEKAKELLRQTEMPIKEIAAAVGYYDASSFIRRFRQHAAITPSQYRQAVRQQSNKAAEQ